MIHGLARPAEDGELIAFVCSDGVLRVGYYDADLDAVADVGDTPPFSTVQAWASITAWWATDNRSRQVRFAPDEPDAVRTVSDADPIG